MSLSLIADVHQRSGEPISAMDWRKILKPAIAFLRLYRYARLVHEGASSRPSNLLRVQNFTAAKPSGVPLVVTARLECIKTPHTDAYWVGRLCSARR